MNLRKLTKTILVGAICCLMNSVTGYMQIGPISFGVETGFAINRLSGEVRDELDKDIEDLREAYEDYEKFRGNVNAVKALNVGFIVEYEINELLAIRSGFRWNKRGYNLKIKGEVEQPDIQLDYKFELETEYKVKTIEFPLTAIYRLSEQSLVYGGILIGWARKKTAFSKVDYYSEFKVNGNVEDSLTDELNEERNLPNSVDNPFIGFTVGLDYMLLPNIYVGVAIQSVSQYAELDIGELDDLSLALSAKYIFNR